MGEKKPLYCNGKIVSLISKNGNSQRPLIMVGVAVIILPKRLTPFFSSVGEPEPEPVEQKLFCVTGAGTRAIISYFGSGSLAPGRVWNLLICSLLFCSKLLILKSESLLAM